MFPVAGLQASLLSLSLGPDRAYDLTLWNALQSGVDSDPLFRTGLALSYVWH